MYWIYIYLARSCLNESQPVLIRVMGINKIPTYLYLPLFKSLFKVSCGIKNMNLQEGVANRGSHIWEIADTVFESILSENISDVICVTHMLLDYGFAINKRGQYAGCGARSRFFHRFSLGTSTMKTLWVLAVEQKLNRESIKRFSGHTFLLCFTLRCDKEYSFLYGLQGDPFLCSSH